MEKDFEVPNMLFRKKIEKSCIYCSLGTQLDEATILCAKKGIRKCADKCARSRYDPCKRIPEKTAAINFSKYDQEDYSL